MSEPWENEPDRLEGDYKGLKLLILRNSRLRHLCGYVGVTKDHPLFGKRYSNSDYPDFDVHGGITFSEEGDEKTRYPQGYWWIGFDCAHAWDLVPKMRSITGNEVYRDIYYVLHETIRLADQIIEVRRT